MSDIFKVCCAAGMAGAIMASASAAHADQITLEMDKARTLRLAEPAATLIIGNPLVADAAIEDRHTLILTGKSYGSTNMIALNSLGETIFNTDLVVTPAQTARVQDVALYRSTERFSFACPDGGSCQGQPRQGDAPAAFETLSQQRGAQIAAARAEAGAQ